jgi:hypothetical protein
MEHQDLYDDFEKVFMKSDTYQDEVYNNLHDNLHTKKQILESFRDYLQVVIKSIDDGEYNVKMINELCEMIDGYYKNNEDDESPPELVHEDKKLAQKMQNNENRLALFSKPKTVKEDDYESDTSESSASSTKVRRIKNNETENSDSESDKEKEKHVNFLDSDDDDTPPIDLKKLVDDERKKRFEQEKKEKEKQEAEEKKVDKFYESFINKTMDINKRTSKVQPNIISYLNNFTKNSFVY